MTRYIKQRDNFRCVPIAFINAIKWAGMDISYESCIDHLCQQMRTRPEDGGSYASYFLPVMRQYGSGLIKIEDKITNPSISQCKAELFNGKALFLSHWVPFEEMLHLTFIPQYDAGFVMVNSFVEAIDNPNTVFVCDDQTFRSRVIRHNFNRRKFFIHPIARV